MIFQEKRGSSYLWVKDFIFRYFAGCGWGKVVLPPWVVHGVLVQGQKKAQIYESYEEIPMSRTLLLPTRSLVMVLRGAFVVQGRNLLASNCRVAVQTELDDIQLRVDGPQIYTIRTVELLFELPQVIDT